MNYLKSQNIGNSVIKTIKKTLEDLLVMWGYKPLVWGRAKGPYSIMKKTHKYAKEGKRSEPETFKDLIAFSIVLENKMQCYEVASLIQSETQCDLRDYEDYILHPKPNGFSQIQMCIVIPEITDVVIEVQIMTYDMYIHNNYGEASHFAYKLQGRRLQQLQMSIVGCRTSTKVLKKASTKVKVA